MAKMYVEKCILLCLKTMWEELLLCSISGGSVSALLGQKAISVDGSRKKYCFEKGLDFNWSKRGERKKKWKKKPYCIFLSVAEWLYTVLLLHNGHNFSY